MGNNSLAGDAQQVAVIQTLWGKHWGHKQQGEDEGFPYSIGENTKTSIKVL